MSDESRAESSEVTDSSAGSYENWKRPCRTCGHSREIHLHGKECCAGVKYEDKLGVYDCRCRCFQEAGRPVDVGDGKIESCGKKEDILPKDPTPNKRSSTLPPARRSLAELLASVNRR